MRPCTRGISASLLLLLGGSLAWADAQPGALKNIEEEDGAPSCFGWQMKVSNASLTDNGDGSCSVSTGAGSGDVTDVGDCATGACLTGTTGSQITFNGTRDFELSAQGNLFFLTDSTNNVALLAIDPANRVGLPQLGSCAVVGTDATGFFKCGTAGAGSVTSVATGTGLTGGPITTTGTISLDLTSLSSATLGAGSFTTLTVDAGATDPVLTFGSGTTSLSASSFEISGATPQVLITDSTASSRDFEWTAEANTLYLSDTTNNATLLAIPAGNVVRWPTYAASCGVLRLGADSQMTCDAATWSRFIPGPALLPGEAADSIPPLSKTAGSNLDIFSVSFDATTDEGRLFMVDVPVTATGTLTFTVFFYSASANGGYVRWDLRTPPSFGAGQQWDAGVTATSATCRIATTTNGVTRCALSTTLSALTWTPGQMSASMLYRDANNAADTMTGDAEVVGLLITGAGT